MTIEEVIKERDDWKSVALSFAKLAQGNVIIDLNSLPYSKNDFDVKEFMKIANTQGISFVDVDIPLPEAVEVLKKELGKDKLEGSYYHAWQYGISMAFKDCMEQAGVHSPDTENHSILVTRYMLHEIANQAAKNFLDLLIKQR